MPNLILSSHNSRKEELDILLDNDGEDSDHVTKEELMMCLEIDDTSGGE